MKQGLPSAFFGNMFYCNPLNHRKKRKFNSDSRIGHVKSKLILCDMTVLSKENGKMFEERTLLTFSVLQFFFLFISKILNYSLFLSCSTSGDGYVGRSKISSCKCICRIERKILLSNNQIYLPIGHLKKKEAVIKEN